MCLNIVSVVKNKYLTVFMSGCTTK